MNEELNLLTISNKLLKTEQELQEKIPELYKAELEYNSKYHEFLLHSLASSAPMREAEAKKRLEEEPIYETYQIARLKVRLLYSRKETFIEICRNLRSYNYGT